MVDVQLSGPLILDAKGELLFFCGVPHLKAYFEAAEVPSGAYGPCWDSEGRLVQLVVEEDPVTVLGVVSAVRTVVHVTAVDEEPRHLADLHFALLRHISECHLEAEMPTSNDTADLLAFAIEHAGWT